MKRKCLVKLKTLSINLEGTALHGSTLDFEIVRDLRKGKAPLHSVVGKIGFVEFISLPRKFQSFVDCIKIVMVGIDLPAPYPRI